MQELDLIVRIAEIILFIALSLLCIYLIISVKKITATVDRVEKQVEGIQTKLNPLIDSSVIISNDIKEISSSVKGQMSKVEDIIDSVKETTDSIIKFEQKTQKEVETQVGDALNFVSAIVTGIKTFVTAVSGTNHLPKRNKSYEPVTDDYTDE